MYNSNIEAIRSIAQCLYTISSTKHIVLDRTIHCFVWETFFCRWIISWEELHFFDEVLRLSWEVENRFFLKTLYRMFATNGSTANHVIIFKLTIRLYDPHFFRPREFLSFEILFVIISTKTIASNALHFHIRRKVRKAMHQRVVTEPWQEVVAWGGNILESFKVSAYNLTAFNSATSIFSDLEGFILKSTDEVCCPVGASNVLKYIHWPIERSNYTFIIQFICSSYLK